MIQFTEVLDGETWELFARDFLSAFGFAVASAPSRGSDLGRDLLVTEQLKGEIGQYKFKWLVSCKHYSSSGNSVGVDDENNILERVGSFGADGFLGFYSTVASSALQDRLTKLTTEDRLTAFRIFDYRLIENYLVTVGYSEVVLRYFPESYERIRPSHKIVDEYIPLKCGYCRKDLLQNINEEKFGALVGEARDIDNSPPLIKDVYWACKGECDQILRRRYEARGLVTGWEDIGDLVIPIYFLRYVLTAGNELRDDRVQYSDNAYEKLGRFIIALAQRTLRETTGEERERVA